jgi:hypothetical protein
MYMERLPDHPEIRWAERTGYPSWAQENFVGYCSCCGCEIYENDDYEETDEGFLCADCYNRKEDEEDD